MYFIYFLMFLEKKENKKNRSLFPLSTLLTFGGVQQDEN